MFSLPCHIKDKLIKATDWAPRSCSDVIKCDSDVTGIKQGWKKGGEGYALKEKTNYWVRLFVTFLYGRRKQLLFKSALCGDWNYTVLFEPSLSLFQTGVEGRSQEVKSKPRRVCDWSISARDFSSVYIHIHTTRVELSLWVSSMKLMLGKVWREWHCTLEPCHVCPCDHVFTFIHSCLGRIIDIHERGSCLVNLKVSAVILICVFFYF